MAQTAAAVAPGSLVLGRYRPIRPLGSGSSGSVWLAVEEESGVEVALKIVPREGNAGARAEREASAAAKLRHDRCLRAHALARDAGHVYIVYEYVPGRTLREAIREDVLDDAAVLEACAADPRRARKRPRARRRPPRREAGERPPRGRSGDERQALRLRPGGHARARDAHRRRRHPGHACVYLARATARRSGAAGR